MIVFEKCSFLVDRLQFLKHKNDIGRTEGGHALRPCMTWHDVRTEQDKTEKNKTN